MLKTLSTIWKNVKRKFLTVFGDIRVLPYPMFIIYDPTYFKMTGQRMLDVISMLKPGDVLLRGYDSYLDGYFIPKTENHGRYSHAGMYIGDNTIIHAVAPAVCQIDVIEFMECDRICVLRPVRSSGRAVRLAKKYLSKRIGYDFDFKCGDENLYCYELCAECYDKLEIPRLDVKILGGLIKRSNCFLADSFFKSGDFEVIFEYNPSTKTDYIKK